MTSATPSTYSDNPLVRLGQKTRDMLADNPYIPALGGTFPSRTQLAFLIAPQREVLFGGAAGGGKSAVLLAGALMYVYDPLWNAVIFRRSFSDLEKPGGLIPLSLEWLSATPAHYDATQHRWHFPGGATLSFGFLATMQEMIRDYQGSAFAYMGFDELTQFPEEMYRYMFSRLRKPAGAAFPLRVRCTSNPGGIGHDWVKARFIDNKDYKARLFIKSMLSDNPGLDRAEYEKSLDELDPLTRAQLKAGDWDIKPEGTMFKREWFREKYVDAPPPGLRRIRYWDLAATKATKEKRNDPDWCAGCLGGASDSNDVFLIDMRHFRETPLVTEDRVKLAAEADGPAVSIRIEQEPGASSKLYIDTFARRVLPAYDIGGFPTNGLDKPTRAKPLSAACQRGNVYIVRGDWNAGFIDELCVEKGTAISTILGDVPIEDIRPGDAVATRLGWRPVLRAERTSGSAETWEINTRKGLVLRGTPSHPVWVTGCGFKRIDRLREGDGLLSFIAGQLSTYIPTPRKGTLRARSTSGTQSCTDIYGNARSAPFRSDTTSTTTTKTPGTIGLKTSAAFHRPSTCGFIQGVLPSPSLGSGLALFVARDTKQRSSEDRERARVNAPGFGRNQRATISSITAAASIAKRVFGQARVAAAFARGDARRKSFKNTVDCLLENAGNAERAFNQFAARPDFVRDDAVLSIRIRPGKRAVYNLEVAGCREYFAGGLLVHNCAFPAVNHDDRVDAATGLYNSLFAQPEFVQGAW